VRRWWRRLERFWDQCCGARPARRWALCAWATQAQVTLGQVAVAGKQEAKERVMTTHLFLCVCVITSTFVLKGESPIDKALVCQWKFAKIIEKKPGLINWEKVARDGALEMHITNDEIILKTKKEIHRGKYTLKSDTTPVIGFMSLAFFYSKGVQGAERSNSLQLKPADRFGDQLPDGALVRLGTLRLRQGGPVEAVAFSPDGRLLASGSHDMPIRLWEVRSYQEVGQLTDHIRRSKTFHYNFTMMFSPDGRFLASGSENNKVYIWDVTERKLVRRLSVHGDAVLGIAWSPDGKTLAASSADKTVSWWDCRTWKLLKHFVGHKRDVWSVTYSADSRFLASSSADLTVRVWDLASCKEVHRFKAARLSWFGSFCVKFSPDGKYLVCGDNLWTIHLWDLTSRKTPRDLHGLPVESTQQEKHLDTITGLVFTQDITSHLISVGWDGFVRIWDFNKATEIRRIPCPVNKLQSIAISPDGQLIATGGSGHAVQVFDILNGSNPVWTFGHQTGVQSCAFSKSGKEVISASTDSIRKWNAHTADVVECRPMSLSCEKKLCVSGTMSFAYLRPAGAVCICKATSGEERCLLHTKCDEILALALSADCNSLAFSESDGNDGAYIHIWDIRAKREVRRIRTGKAWIDRVAFSPDGKLVAGAFRAEVSLWHRGSGTLNLTLSKHEAEISALAFAFDGKAIVTGDSDGNVCLWDTGAGQLLLTFRVAGGAICSLAASRDEKWIAAGNTRGAISLLESETGDQRARFTGHRSVVRALDFSPNNDRLASASDDTTVLIWDILGKTKE
jgi:WD40 repeat protein